MSQRELPSGKRKSAKKAFRRTPKQLGECVREIQVLDATDRLQHDLKKRRVKIPISETVDLIYTPTGTNIRALVVSPDFTENRGGDMIFIESGSHHGEVGLWKIPQEPSKKLMEKLPVEGFCDKDTTTRKITAIYLSKKDIKTAAGKFTDLINNPNIQIKK